MSVVIVFGILIAIAVSIVLVTGGVTAVQMVKERHEQKLEEREIEKEKELEKEKQKTALFDEEEL